MSSVAVSTYNFCCLLPLLFGDSLRICTTPSAYISTPNCALLSRPPSRASASKHFSPFTMAKSRRNRSGAARRDPIAKPVKAPSDPELAALRESKILPVIKDLKSSDPKSRSSAAAAVSNIIQDPRCRKLLLREQVVHTILTETLTDAALESRAAGWGILQVLAQEEEADFCIHLFRSDALTAIEFASKQVRSQFPTPVHIPHGFIYSLLSPCRSATDSLPKSLLLQRLPRLSKQLLQALPPLSYRFSRPSPRLAMTSLRPSRLTKPSPAFSPSSLPTAARPSPELRMSRTYEPMPSHAS